LLGKVLLQFEPFHQPQHTLIKTKKELFFITIHQKQMSK
jgi:hypothetical protein